MAQKLSVMTQVKRGFSRLMLSPDDRARRSATSLGLTLDQACPLTVARDAVRSSVRGLVEAGQFAELEQQYNDAFERKTKLPDGSNLYACLGRFARDVIVPGVTPVATAETFVWSFEEHWEASGRSPFMSGLFAGWLFSTGYCHRGVFDASMVTPKGWEMLGTYTDAAHSALAECEEAAVNCPLWHRTLFSIGLADGSSAEELQRRFDDALALDTQDIDLHLSRAYQMLPRWHGSYEVLEEFAQQAAARTGQETGLALYARIYWSVAEHEALPETACDWPTLKRGFEDWVRQIPEQSIVNSFAAAAYLYEDFDTLHKLALDKLGAFHRDAWWHDDLAADALDWLAINR